MKTQAINRRADRAGRLLGDPVRRQGSRALRQGRRSRQTQTTTSSAATPPVQRPVKVMTWPPAAPQKRVRAQLGRRWATCLLTGRPAMGRVIRPGLWLAGR